MSSPSNLFDGLSDGSDMINKKTTLERKLDNKNQTIKPIRTIVPIAILIIQSIILIKLFNQGESNGKIN